MFPACYNGLNINAVGQVAAEAWVLSLAQCSGLKDLALLHLWHRLQLQLIFSAWLRNFHGCSHKKKKGKYLFPMPCDAGLLGDRAKDRDLEVRPPDFQSYS